MGIGMLLVAIGTAMGVIGGEEGVQAVDWGLVIPEILAGLGLLLARDNNKSSEDVGAR